MRGVLNGARVSAEAKKLLAADADGHTWAAAAIGAQNAESCQLTTGEPVMAIGGFGGSDPSPTLARFKQYVADGKIRYLIAGGKSGGEGTSSAITAWVESALTRVPAGSATFYDLDPAGEVATPRPCALGRDNGLYAVWELFYGV
ncbi:hypothetical protein [Streptomyces sp. NPDC018584]|uniref:hypothetical protein n=1 Tax=unclassified Streptomyces TaxID=2593676 RepID=UPI0037A66091